MDELIWKDIPLYEGYYQCNILGEVRALDRIGSDGRLYHGHNMKPIKTGDGYVAYLLYKNGKSRVIGASALVKILFDPIVASFDGEIWKPVKDYECYFVSNYGRIKRIKMLYGLQTYKFEFLINQTINNNGYYYVTLSYNKKQRKVLSHILVAETFIPNPYKYPEVDHIDTNPKNNCVDNLRWCTRKDNMNNPLTRKHNSQSKTGVERPERRKAIIVLKDGVMVGEYDSAVDLCDNSMADYGVQFFRGNVCKVLKGVRSHSHGYVFVYKDEPVAKPIEPDSVDRNAQRSVFEDGNQ